MLTPSLFEYESRNYLHKEKAFDWSGIRRYNSAEDTQTIKDLSVAKIILEFANPKNLIK
jgi:hypothetical protein